MEMNDTLESLKAEVVSLKKEVDRLQAQQEEHQEALETLDNLQEHFRVRENEIAALLDGARAVFALQPF